MIKWKLVAYPTDSSEHMYPTTYGTPEGTIDSFQRIVSQIVADPSDADVIWQDLIRTGAHYAQWTYVTLVLVSYEIL